ncbi:MAG: class I SAM-dependent methyltransferase [Verrucomicrobiota bacterium]
MMSVPAEPNTDEITPAFYVHDRLYFPEILNGLNLLGEGVEVGTFQGAFSAWILERWKGKKLYSIDPWKSFPKDEYIDMVNFPDEEFEKYYQDAVSILKKYGDRSAIIRKTSEEAAPLFADASLDFVYLDAQHHYEAIQQDIARWWPKIKPLGILSGHDYIPDGDYPFGRFGVKRAVNEFVRANNLQLILSQERTLDQFLADEPASQHLSESDPAPAPSWFIIKPQA